MNHKRILVALSLTDGPDPAFERALALAKASGAELYLLHAVQQREETLVIDCQDYCQEHLLLRLYDPKPAAVGADG